MSVKSPLERLTVDTVGPLPQDEEGNKWIIVIVDTFSRYIQLYAAKDSTACCASKSLFHFICTYGIPSELLSDNGTTQYV